MYNVYISIPSYRILCVSVRREANDSPAADIYSNNHNINISQISFRFRYLGYNSIVDNKISNNRKFIIYYY